MVKSHDHIDIYARVTNQIVKAIENGVEAWQMPWHSDGAANRPINVVTGKPYRGVNVVELWIESQLHGYAHPVWGTFKQWLDLRCPVRKGEKGTLCVFWKPVEKGQIDEHAEPDLATHRLITRSFVVFNADQVDGYKPFVQPVRPEHQRIADAETFFNTINADIRHGGDRAYYRPSDDRIQMPPFEVFVDPIAYYSTLAHECCHWTGASSRLARDLSGRFGSDCYAFEELIAELGAAFIAADLGLNSDPRPENASYINTWLKVLKADNRAIFTAASHAQRAADYLHSQQPNPLPILIPKLNTPNNPVLGI